MNHYRHKFMVPAPLARVEAFHQDSRALKRLTPPPVITQMHRVEPLAEGSIAEFTLWMGPIPIRWRARHELLADESGFVDIQESGPYSYWKHQHMFVQLDGNQTEVRDEITAKFGHGLWKGVISRLMWISLPILFTFRGYVTRRIIAQS